MASFILLCSYDSFTPISIFFLAGEITQLILPAGMKEVDLSQCDEFTGHEGGGFTGKADFGNERGSEGSMNNVG